MCGFLAGVVVDIVDTWTDLSLLHDLKMPTIHFIYNIKEKTSKLLSIGKTVNVLQLIDHSNNWWFYYFINVAALLMTATSRWIDAGCKLHFSHHTQHTQPNSKLLQAECIRHGWIYLTTPHVQAIYGPVSHTPLLSVKNRVTSFKIL